MRPATSRHPRRLARFPGPGHEPRPAAHPGRTGISARPARRRLCSTVRRAGACRPARLGARGRTEPSSTRCARCVDRLPLGVELAAARVAHLPLTAVRDRLAAHLPLPGSGPRNVPDRQRTLAGAIAWSHELLPPTSQRVLHDLAVFEGSFDLEQAEAVVEGTGGATSLDQLVELVDQSLVQRDAPDASGAGVRFRLLETIRALRPRTAARDEGREDAARSRHALAYLALAETAAPNLPGPDQPRWLDRLDGRLPQPSHGDPLVDRRRRGGARTTLRRRDVAVLAAGRAAGRRHGTRRGRTPRCRAGRADAGADGRRRRLPAGSRTGTGARRIRRALLRRSFGLAQEIWATSRAKPMRPGTWLSNGSSTMTCPGLRAVRARPTALSNTSETSLVRRGWPGR